MTIDEQEFTEQDRLEGELILGSVNRFLTDAAAIKTPDMTALMCAYIETCINVLAERTDPDTAMSGLSQMLMRLAPRCKRAKVQLLHMAPEGKQ